MKKLLKIVIVLIFVATICIYPTCIVYASTASTPVLVYYSDSDYGMLKFYEYQYQNQSEPLDLLAGQTTYLMDFANPSTTLWQVPAGKGFCITANLPLVGSYVRLQIFKPGTGFIFDVVTDSLGYVFPPEQQDREYIIFITAINNAQISDYAFNTTD
jgi:hypothetical protein